MPLLSIIITSYNVEDYLDESITDIRDQTLQDLEIVVVDDGSTDTSPEIIARHAAEDDRVVPILLGENSPGGVATAANAGLDAATGTYVGFADGDDRYDPTMFQRLLEAAQADDADLAACGYVLLDDKTGETAPPADQKRWDQLEAKTYQLDNENVVKSFLRLIAVPWRKIYRRSMLEEGDIRFPVGDYFFEDNPFHWFSVLSATSIAVVPDALCQHRVARVGQTMSTVDSKLLRIFDHHPTILSWLKAKQLDGQYGTTLVGWAVSQLEWISQKAPKDLQRELFNRGREVVGEYTAAQVETALVEGSKGRRAKEMCAALRANDFDGFVSAGQRKPTQRSLLDRGLSHLREDGLLQTSTLAGRYFGQQTKRVARQTGATRVIKGAGRQKVDREDLLFALMLIERRLEALDGKVDALQSSVEELSGEL